MKTAIFIFLIIVSNCFIYSQDTKLNSYVFSSGSAVSTNNSKFILGQPFTGLSVVQDTKGFIGFLHPDYGLPNSVEIAHAGSADGSFAYPIPAVHQLTINWDAELLGHLEIKVYSLLGTLVDVIQIDNSAGLTNSISINTTDYDAGVYIYQLGNSTKWLRNRFIISN